MRNVVHKIPPKREIDSISNTLGVDTSRQMLAMYEIIPTIKNKNTEKMYITAKFSETSLSGKGFGSTVPM